MYLTTEFHEEKKMSGEKGKINNSISYLENVYSLDNWKEHNLVKISNI
jgi:hypothetical protein